MNEFLIELIKFYINKIPNKNTKGRKNEKDIEHYIEVIYKVLRSGSQSKNINSPLHYTTYHKNFIKWNNNDLFQNVFYIIIKLLKYENILNNDFLQLLTFQMPIFIKTKYIFIQYTSYIFYYMFSFYCIIFFYHMNLLIFYNKKL